MISVDNCRILVLSLDRVAGKGVGCKIYPLAFFPSTFESSDFGIFFYFLCPCRRRGLAESKTKEEAGMLARKKCRFGRDFRDDLPKRDSNSWSAAGAREWGAVQVSPTNARDPDGVKLRDVTSRARRNR